MYMILTVKIAPLWNGDSDVRDSGMSPKIAFMAGVLRLRKQRNGTRIRCFITLVYVVIK
jgi:hypothetical protein